MRSRWYWMARVRSQLNQADALMPRVGNKEEYQTLVWRIQQLYVYIGDIGSEKNYVV